MIIAIGKDTKRISQFVGMDKRYIATIDFTMDSDTRDVDYRKEFKTLQILEQQVETIPE
ncbi:MAG: hypothetical protein H6765_11045 [Candidatus Peribacteria bacterium]|nr:MAG: hypothetical protein H6765_11045 [Candidatus Peribacteria bacterium]